MGTEIKCGIITWDEVYDACRKLVRLIEDSEYVPEILIGLARSGFVPARLLSDFSGITNLYSLKVEHWLDTTAQHKEEAKITSKLPIDVHGKKVLVIDDIADTGKSMDLTFNYIKSFAPSEIKSAVVHYVTSSQHVPDYYAHKIEEWTWLIYPWNMIEDLANLTVKLLKSSNNLTLEKIQMGLKEKFEIEVNLERIEEIVDVLQRRKKIAKRTDQIIAL
ncbi:MAG: phosphoribosyltransferase [Candidatus Bathyarchaeota archaeon]